jgi:hypothetical protein
MKITIEMVITVIGLIALLAATVERGVELFKPGLNKISDEEWRKVAKLGAAILLGFGLAFLVRLDVLALLGFTFHPVAGYVTAGILASAGASPWHAILEWLKTIKPS